MLATTLAQYSVRCKDTVGHLVQYNGIVSLFLQGHCRNMGAHLITVDSEAKDNFIKQFLNVFASESCFRIVFFIIKVAIDIKFWIPQ